MISQMLNKAISGQNSPEAIKQDTQGPSLPFKHTTSFIRSHVLKSNDEMTSNEGHSVSIVEDFSRNTNALIEVS